MADPQPHHVADLLQRLVAWRDEHRPYPHPVLSPGDVAVLIRTLHAYEAARKDAERLDWLDRDDIEIGFLTRNNGTPFVRIADWRDGRLLGEADTLREAIDVARAAIEGK